MRGLFIPRLWLVMHFSLRGRFRILTECDLITLNLGGFNSVKQHQRQSSWNQFHLIVKKTVCHKNKNWEWNIIFITIEKVSSVNCFIPSYLKPKTKLQLKNWIFFFHDRSTTSQTSLAFCGVYWAQCLCIFADVENYA